MYKKLNIKKGDQVVVLSGKDKGKKGKVLVADPKNGKVIVEGINMATKHKKPRSPFFMLSFLYIFKSSLTILQELKIRFLNIPCL